MDLIFATRLLHAPFLLIRYAARPYSEKKFNFDILTPPSGWGGASGGKILATMLLHASFPLIRFAT